jgi:hypothetical protein
MQKKTLEENDFEKELEKLDPDLQEKIKNFKNIETKPVTRKNIETYLEAKDIAIIRTEVSEEVSHKTIYTYLDIERRIFSRLRDDGLKELNSTEKQEVKKKTKIKVFEETNEIILQRLEEIKKQNEKIISFYELLTKEEKEKKEENKQELDDNDMEDTEIENSTEILRSFRVNSCILGQFLRIAKKKDMKVQTATNTAFRMFIEKYN